MSMTTENDEPDGPPSRCSKGNTDEENNSSKPNCNAGESDCSLTNVAPVSPSDCTISDDGSKSVHDGIVCTGKYLGACDESTTSTSDQPKAVFEPNTSQDEAYKSPLTPSIVTLSNESKTFKVVTSHVEAGNRDDVLSTPKTTKKKKRKPAQKKEGQTTGRWTPEEHEAFLEGLKMHGREWKKVAERITTRTSAQIRSHAQKYFAKMAKEEGQAHTVSLSLSDEPQTEALGLKPSGLSVTALEQIDKIMKDPYAVENEIQTTLSALQERYRQLQLRLEARRQKKMSKRRTHNRESIALISEVSSDHNQPLEQAPVGPATAALERALSDEVSRKRKRMDNDDSTSGNDDDRMPLSRFNVTSKELIALQVLGGGLPKSLSSQRLMNPDSEIGTTDDMDTNKRIKSQMSKTKSPKNDSC